MTAVHTAAVALDPSWIDYNGHLNDMAYAQIVGVVNEQAADALGLGADYLANEGCSLYTVDLHLRYLAEVRGDDGVTVEVDVAEAGEKKLALHTRIVRSDGKVAAEATVLYLHVNATTGRTEPFGAAARGRIGLA